MLKGGYSSQRGVAGTVDSRALRRAWRAPPPGRVVPKASIRRQSDRSTRFQACRRPTPRIRI